MRTKISHIIAAIFLLNVSASYAEMTRVYHPYVEQHEREIEYGFVLRDPGKENVLLNRAGAGYTWNENFFSEIYILTESITHEKKQVHGYELELKWQLTEQGEYWADWGLLVEAGASRDIDSYEIATGLLWEKELSSHWVAAANFIVEYEYGDDIKNEFEGALRAQLRYRNSVTFDPAIELYLDDKDWAVGPAFLGAIKLSGRKQLRWELGLLFGLDEETPETSLRGGIEFEF